MSQGNEIPTVNSYLRNIVQLLRYLEDTPPRTCRLRRFHMKGIITAVEKAVHSLGRNIVTHQLKVKAKKMDKVVSRENLRSCNEKARLVISALLSKTVCIPK